MGVVPGGDGSKFVDALPGGEGMEPRPDVDAGQAGDVGVHGEDTCPTLSSRSRPSSLVVWLVGVSHAQEGREDAAVPICKNSNGRP